MVLRTRLTPMLLLQLDPSVTHAIVLNALSACSPDCCRDQSEEACEFESIARSLGIRDASAQPP